MGTFALRTPSDLMNWMQVVFKMDAQAAFQALHTSATFALEQAHMRRFGGGGTNAEASIIIPVEGLSMTVEGVGDDHEGTSGEANHKDKKKQRNVKRTKAVSASADEKEQEDQHVEDGFIAF